MIDDPVSFLADGFRENNAQVGFTERFRAYLGHGNDQTLITNPNGLRPREVWFWRDTSQGRESGLAILPDWIPYDNLTALWGTEIEIGKWPGSNIFEVLRITPDHGARKFGDYSLQDQKTNAAYYTPVSNMTTLRVTPTTPSPSLAVIVSSGFYEKTSTGEQIYSSDGRTLSVSTEQAALASGEHQLTKVCIDTETDTLVLQTSTAVTAAGSLPARSEFTGADVAAVDMSTYLPIGAIYLYFGQTSVTEDDLLRNYEPRMPFTRSGSGSAEIDSAIYIAWSAF